MINKLLKIDILIKLSECSTKFMNELVTLNL